jgi:4a-hydroxytetrahydrobiopterin dehydratase
MSQLSYEKLSDEAVQTGLAALEGWAVADGMLTRTYSFSSYADGVVFAAAVGHVADRLDHHPDLMIGYRRVTVAMITHDAGGLTSYDFELAKRISALG